MDKLIGPISVMINAYAEGTIDELHIVYTRFVNTMKQEPTLEQLLPLSTKHMAVEHSHPWDYLFEPDVKSVLDFLVRRYLESVIYQGVAENMASTGRPDGGHEGRHGQCSQSDREPQAHLQQGPSGSDYHGTFRNRRGRRCGVRRGQPIYF